MYLSPPRKPGAPQGKTVLPVLPTSEVVLFPRVIMPLSLWEDKAQKLVDDVILTDKIFGMWPPGRKYPRGTAPTISSTSAPRRSS